MTTTVQRRAKALRMKALADAKGPKRERRGWTTSLFYGGGAYGNALTRVQVNPHTALTMATVHACIRVLSEAISVMPLVVYERLDGGGKRKATSHPIFRLLTMRPNPEMTPAVWKQTLMGHLLTWGNAYARIVFDGAGRAAELWPMDPADVQVGRDTVTGRLKYAHYDSEDNGKLTVYDADQVLHIPGLSYDGVTGYSPVGLMRETIGLGMGLEQFAGKAIDNGAWMAYVVRHPDELDDDTFDRIRETLYDKQGGIANAYRPGLLEDGMELQQLRMPGDDAMFLNLRKFEKREIAAAYRVPPHMLADLEGGASYSSIEVMSIEFARYSLGIWLAKWSEECSRKLLMNRRDYFVEFLVEALLRGDTQARYEAYKVGREGGWLNVDEIRSSENMEPLPDGAGQGYLVPMNMGVVGTGEDPVEPAEVEDDPEDRSLTLHLRGAAVAAMKRLVGKELERLERYRSKGPDAVSAWAERFYANHRASMLSVLEEYAIGLALALAPVGTDPDELAGDVRQVVRDVVDEDLRRAQQATTWEPSLTEHTFNDRPLLLVDSLVTQLKQRVPVGSNGQ